MLTRTFKIGRSLAVRIPKEIAIVEAGQKIEIEKVGNTHVLRPVERRKLTGIADEAHRSIGGNARAVFDYFIGYKLGLTATPRDYLRRFDSSKPGTRDPREAERRLLLDTYRTFGCRPAH